MYALVLGTFTVCVDLHEHCCNQDKEQFHHKILDTIFYKLMHVYMHACMYGELLSHVWLFVTPWTLVYQAPLFMEFSKRGYWSVLPFPTPGNLPARIKTVSLASPALLGILFTNIFFSLPT